MRGVCHCLAGQAQRVEQAAALNRHRVEEMQVVQNFVVQGESTRGRAGPRRSAPRIIFVSYSCQHRSGAHLPVLTPLHVVLSLCVHFPQSPPLRYTFCRAFLSLTVVQILDNNAFLLFVKIFRTLRPNSHSLHCIPAPCITVQHHSLQYNRLPLSATLIAPFRVRRTMQ